MSQILILLRKGLLTFSRARAAITITFIVPIVLIYLFGHVFGLYSHDSGPSGIPIAVVNESDEPAAQELVKALQSEKALYVLTWTKGPDGVKHPITEAEARAAMQDNKYRFALILPKDLMSDTRLGLRMRFLSNPRNEIETQTVNGLVQKTVFSRVPQLLGQSLQRRAKSYLGDDRFHQFNERIAAAVTDTYGGDREAAVRRIESGDFFNTARADASKNATTTPSAAPAGTGGESAEVRPASSGEDLFSRVVKIETEQVVGKDVKSPMAARTVGGYAIMFLLMAVSGAAASLFEERNSGMFQRLLSSPVRPGHIVGARFLFGIILGLVQLSAMLVAGRIFFGMEIFGQPLALVAIALSAAAACAAFGVLVAAVSPSAAAAQGISTFLVLSMSAVGGAWFPVSMMPSYIQTVSKFTIVYWAVEGITDVLWAGRSLIEIMPKIGILLGIAAAAMAIALWAFRRNRFFE